MRVLVSSALADFLRAEAVPPDIAAELLPDDASMPPGDFAGILPHVARPVRAADLDRLPALRIIANYGVGYDNIDITAARGRGIAVTNTPGVLTGATAELTWALILAAARRLGEGERLARSGAWGGWQPTQLRGTSLEGKILGIVGAGRIGQEVGRRARVFGMRLLYWNRSPRPEWEAETGARPASLETLLAEADVVSLHVALAGATHHLLDAPALARMKPGAILVNTARGPVVDEAALADALEAGRLRAAGLDVFEREPHIPERLRRLEQVVLLPHLGSATEEARLAMWRLAWANCLRGLRGEPLLNPVAE
jgi:glyoxylate reductase